MAIAELQVQGVALHRGAIADPVDLEVAGEAVGDPGDHVVDQRAGGSPHRARALALVLRRDRDLAVGDRGGDLVGQRDAQGAEPALGGQRLARQLDLHPGGDRDRILTDTRHRLPRISGPQNTRHSTSPPTLAARASLSDMTPRGVDRMAMPRPL